MVVLVQYTLMCFQTGSPPSYLHDRDYNGDALLDRLEFPSISFEAVQHLA
jgi:hypothetical protein